MSLAPELNIHCDAKVREATGNTVEAMELSETLNSWRMALKFPSCQNVACSDLTA